VKLTLNKSKKYVYDNILRDVVRTQRLDNLVKVQTRNCSFGMVCYQP